ncbi:axoneme-associated protein mst101(2)-like [Olea europaea var. sylvestris]|uniref:axoneme-associated protein mst101(2)-like n=1 Tax=Olea europaea var. sylvestris TaxID=158386 RepID=UPI000C1D7F0F|nr:axoneme-associated protein mst101(2)-like [Olea europaea var. sylvestris]
MASRDKFKRKNYPAPDMATILKATTTAKARALKPGSSGAKEVRGKVEHLSKDSTPKAPEEGASQRQERPKEPRGKEKVPEKAKRRKLVHVTSSSGKFGTSVSHEAKSTSEPKLFASASKAIKIEMVREAEAEAEAEAEEAREEAARRASEASEEEAAKQKHVREKGKSPSFLAGREETLAPALVKALPEEVRSATENFYRFWTDRWQLYASSCDASDLTRVLVSQSVRTFDLALECREALSDFQSRTRSSEEKTASLAEEVKAVKVETEEVRAQKLEEMAKLESALAQIEALKKEVHESQCEVASLIKKVEVFNEHQKVTAEALEKANLSWWVPKSPTGSWKPNSNGMWMMRPMPERKPN